MLAEHKEEKEMKKGILVMPIMAGCSKLSETYNFYYLGGCSFL